MTVESKLMCGIILITIPSIEYGGYFLLMVLSGKFTKIEFNAFQKSMFRAGHAHAGVIVILSLVCQLLADHVALPLGATWFVRASIPASALLISGGFFFSSMSPNATRPSKLVALIYTGALLLAAGLITLGVGLLI
ncbi:hypothetical protein ACFQ21_04240 [Ohtaekwangia kribbensis]|jgi:hypothetical protein|uniref:Uncharacterized protein n=1 Tax=Ohtaekwangia kribbensis TaxID=688913 RepID=A0ABW3JY27_9BACT